MRTLAENFGLALEPGNHAAEAVPAVNALRSFLEVRDYLSVEDNYLLALPGGTAVAEEADVLLTCFEEDLYLYFSAVYAEDAEEVLNWVADPIGYPKRPKNPEFVVDLFIALGVLEQGSTQEQIVHTAPGREVLQIMLTFPEA